MTFRLLNTSRRPIIEKFKRLTGNKKNKITAADVSGPSRMRTNTVEFNTVAEVVTSPVPELRKASMAGEALTVVKKIGEAFREEVLVTKVKDSTHGEDDESGEKDATIDYSKFCIPKNTVAIAIDDSKIQRKLLGKFFDFAGIPNDRYTVVGESRDEIMGFEDFVVSFIDQHNDDYIFLLVDENLDVVTDDSKQETVSGSLCVENIRKRLLREQKRRLFALIRSANDSSSDVAIYKSRAHGFLPKAPIKRGKVTETLAPLWLTRFPPSDFNEFSEMESRPDTRSLTSDIVASSSIDIAQKLIEIEALFAEKVYLTAWPLIHAAFFELKGDLLTLDTSVSVISIVGTINLMLVAQAPETIAARWIALRKRIEEIIKPSQIDRSMRRNSDFTKRPKPKRLRSISNSLRPNSTLSDDSFEDSATKGTLASSMFSSSSDNC